ncbi:MAG: hypothetical protein ACLVJO_04180 [[Clostridium] scindens]
MREYQSFIGISSWSHFFDVTRNAFLGSNQRKRREVNFKKMKELVDATEG